MNPRQGEMAGILLEAGTNELEVMIFLLGGGPYGINVAKVREVMAGAAVRRLPESHPAVEGVFELRDRVVPLVSLRAQLGLDPYPPEALRDPTATRIIVTEFHGGRQTAFRVDAVERICRVSMEQVQPVPRLAELAGAPVVALVQLEDGLVPMLDFEMIVAHISGREPLTASVAAPSTQALASRAGRRIVVAEDSAIIQGLIRRTLEGAGYQQLQVFSNGKEAWDFVRRAGAEGRVDVVITDIEMPQVDGLHLCRLIREDAGLRDLPVILFSSLVTPDNRRKGESVGATAQITKPELGLLVEMIEQVLSRRQVG